MYFGESIRLVLAILLMFASLIMRSKLAEYRIDDISADGGMGRGWGNLRESLETNRYSPAGRRLLPWLRFVTAATFVALLAFVFGPHKV